MKYPLDEKIHGMENLLDQKLHPRWKKKEEKNTSEVGINSMKFSRD